MFDEIILLMCGAIRPVFMKYIIIKEKRMNISKKMGDAINTQVNRELFSAYLYLQMAAYFAERNLNGFAHWLKL